MRYHNITKDDMLNGDGLRVVLFLSSCPHRCEGCHNPQTHSPNSGINFDIHAKEKIFNELEKDYISGITFSGGDPLDYHNIKEVTQLSKEIKEKYPLKTIWLYTGFEWKHILSWIDVNKEILQYVDVLVDGRFDKRLADINYCWAGSTNQNIIDVKASLKHNKVILHET